MQSAGPSEARVNTIIPEITITPLAKAELSSPRGEGCWPMLSLAPVGPAGTPEPRIEVFQYGNIAGATGPCLFRCRRKQPA